MVQGGFPGSALVTQLFRQLTKPASQRIVNYAARHPTFRRYFLLAPGRLYYRLETHLERLKTAPMIVPKGQKKPKVKPLKEDEAVMLGSQLVIEIVIFALLALILTCDWLRSQRKSSLEDNRRQAEFAELERRKSEARERLEALELETELLRSRLLEGRKQEEERSVKTFTD